MVATPPKPKGPGQDVKSKTRNFLGGGPADHAERTANRGAPARPSGPMAFERVPSVMPDASPDERKKAMAAKMRAALSQAKGLGDLKSGL